MGRNGKNPPNPIPAAPEHLSQAAAEWWTRIVETWEIGRDDADALLLLESALVSFDRARQAREILAVEGLTVSPEGGMPHPHPATRIERDSLKEMRLSLKALGLDPTILQGGKR